MRNSIFLLTCLFLFSCFEVKNQNSEKINYHFENAESVLPKPIGFVNDFTHTFTKEQRKSLENYLLDYKNKTSNEIAVVTIDSISPYVDIKDFGTDLGNFWGIGTKEKNNGLLIVLSMNERNIGISTGKETEKVLSDEFLKKIIDAEIIPLFKQEKFYEGIMSALNKIMEQWNKSSP